MKLPKLDLTMQKKTCKPVFLGRMWQASRRALHLEYSPAHQFACCQWQSSQKPSTPYLIYRWLLFIAITSIGIASFTFQKLPERYEGPKVELNYFKWFIYFTNWGYMLIIVQAGLAVAVVHRYRAEKSYNIPSEEDDSLTPRRPRTPTLCRAYWLTQVVATDVALVITLVYWTVVYDPKLHDINALNVLVHAGNTVVMLIEVAVTSHPVRVAHVLYGVGAGVAYGIFSAFYWAVGGTDKLGLPAIYPPLNWNKPASALTFVAICVAAVIFAHALVSCLVALRTRIAARLRPSQLDRLTLPAH